MKPGESVSPQELVAVGTGEVHTVHGEVRLPGGVVVPMDVGRVVQRHREHRLRNGGRDRIGHMDRHGVRARRLQPRVFVERGNVVFVGNGGHDVHVTVDAVPVDAARHLRNEEILGIGFTLAVHAERLTVPAGAGLPMEVDPFGVVVRLEVSRGIGLVLHHQPLAVAAGQSQRRHRKKRHTRHMCSHRSPSVFGFPVIHQGIPPACARLDGRRRCTFRTTVSMRCGAVPYRDSRARRLSHGGDGALRGPRHRESPFVAVRHVPDADRREGERRQPAPAASA